VASGEDGSDPLSGRGHVVHGHDRPGEQHLREAQHREGQRRLGGVPDGRRRQEAQRQCGPRRQQEGEEHRRVHVATPSREPVEGPEGTEEHHDHTRQDGQQHRKLGGDVGADAEPGEALAPEHRQLADDLQEAVREPEEEPGERQPEHDLRRRGPRTSPGLERPGAEQHRHHGGDQGGRAEEDRQRQAVVDQQVDVPPGEEQALRDRARPPDAGGSRRRAGRWRGRRGHRRGPVPGEAGRQLRGRRRGELLVNLGEAADLEVPARLGRRPGEGQVAVAGEEHDPIAALEVGGLVGGQHDGDAPAGEPAQQSHDVGRGRGVEPGGGLVEEQHAGVREQFGGDAGPLALAARQGAHGDRGPVGQVESVERLVDQPVDHGPRRAGG
jgi:hypothetical protein